MKITSITTEYSHYSSFRALCIEGCRSRCREDVYLLHSEAERPRGLRARKSLLFELRYGTRAEPERSIPECASREIKVARMISRSRGDLPLRRIFPRWTSSGSAAAALSRLANGNRRRRASRERGTRRGEDETGARLEEEEGDKRESARAGIRITGTALEMRSQARRREKGSDRRRYPGLAEGD